MKNMLKPAAVAAALLALVLSGAGCGEDDSKSQTSTNPYDSIPNYGQAIEKAQDVAAQAEQQAQEAEKAMREATGSP
jgi:hypothetical protein